MQHGIDGFLDGFLDADLEAVTNNRRLSGYETELGGMYHDHRGFEVPGNLHMHNMYGRAVAEAQDDDDRRSFRRGVGGHVEIRSGRRSSVPCSSEARNAAERFDRAGPQQLAELCERLALERDQAVEEAKEARSARDSALAACAQLASIAPDRRAERDAHQVRERTLTVTVTVTLTLTRTRCASGRQHCSRRTSTSRACAPSCRPPARSSSRTNPKPKPNPNPNPKPNPSLNPNPNQELFAH